MPIRIDKIYDRDTDNYVLADNLIKYNREDNTIRNLLDDILIKIDDIKLIDFNLVEKNIEDWENKIDDLQNQFDKVYELLLNITDNATIELSLQKLNEIENKINEIENNLKIDIQTINSDIDNLDNKIDETDKELNEKIDELNKKLDVTIENINSKLLKIKNYITLDYQKYIFKFDKITKETILNFKIHRNIFEDKTYIKYCFTDTETTNYFDLINPKTGKSIRFYDCGKTKRNELGCCILENKNLQYLLENQNDNYIDIKIKIYQKDYKGFGNLIFAKQGYQNIKLPLKNSDIEIAKINLENQFQASILCDMYNDNYPFNNNHLIKNGYYNPNNLKLFFEVPINFNSEYEFGCLLGSGSGKVILDLSKYTKLNYTLTNNNFVIFDNKKFYANNNIISFSNVSNSIKFNVLISGSVDRYPDDYIKISNGDKEAILQFKLYGNRPDFKIIKNDFDVEFNIIKEYNTSLQTNYPYSKLIEIIANINGDVNIELHCNQSQSDEGIYFEEYSAFEFTPNYVELFSDIVEGWNTKNVELNGSLRVIFEGNYNIYDFYFSNNNPIYDLNVNDKYDIDIFDNQSKLPKSWIYDKYILIPNETFIEWKYDAIYEVSFDMLFSGNVNKNFKIFINDFCLVNNKPIDFLNGKKIDKIFDNGLIYNYDYIIPFNFLVYGNDIKLIFETFNFDISNGLIGIKNLKISSKNYTIIKKEYYEDYKLVKNYSINKDNGILKVFLKCNNLENRLKINGEEKSVKDLNYVEYNNEYYIILENNVEFIDEFYIKEIINYKDDNKKLIYSNNIKRIEMDIFDDFIKDNDKYIAKVNTEKYGFENVKYFLTLYGKGEIELVNQNSKGFEVNIYTDDITNCKLQWVGVEYDNL